MNRQYAFCYWRWCSPARTYNISTENWIMIHRDNFGDGIDRCWPSLRYALQIDDAAIKHQPNKCTECRYARIMSYNQFGSVSMPKCLFVGKLPSEFSCFLFSFSFPIFEQIKAHLLANWLAIRCNIWQESYFPYDSILSFTNFLSSDCASLEMWERLVGRERYRFFAFLVKSFNTSVSILPNLKWMEFDSKSNSKQH